MTDDALLRAVIADRRALDRELAATEYREEEARFGDDITDRERAEIRRLTLGDDVDAEVRRILEL